MSNRARRYLDRLNSRIRADRLRRSPHLRMAAVQSHAVDPPTAGFLDDISAWGRCEDCEVACTLAEVAASAVTAFARPEGGEDQSYPSGQSPVATGAGANVRRAQSPRGDMSRKFPPGSNVRINKGRVR